MKGYYRRKPVSVEAARWDGSTDAEGTMLFSGVFGDEHRSKLRVVAGRLQVMTEAGTAMANPGDWIVFWKNSSKKLQIFSDEDFRKDFEVDERTARVRGWREEQG